MFNLLMSLPAAFAVHATSPCSPLDPTAVELFEVEVKHLVPDLGLLPVGVADALKSGRAHDQLPRRGLVLQEYVPVTPENLAEVFTALTEAKVPFGGPEDHARLAAPGAAREIRLMTKSIRVNGQPTLIRQLAIKAAGGVAVNQLETPEHLPAAAAAHLGRVFARFRPRVTAVVRKIYFEIAQPFGNVEVDAYLSAAGTNQAPVFINGEIEFHGADATDRAAAWRADPSRHPRYLGRDLTDTPGCKARDIAATGVPGAVADEVRAHQARNHNFVVEVGREFRT